MLLAILRIPWIIIPATFVVGLFYGLYLNSDHRLCAPGQTLQQQTETRDLRWAEASLQLAQRQRRELIMVCQGIEHTNPAMLTDRCKQVLPSYLVRY